MSHRIADKVVNVTMSPSTCVRHIGLSGD
jgi:hypothetical protein